MQNYFFLYIFLCTVNIAESFLGQFFFDSICFWSKFDYGHFLFYFTFGIHYWLKWKWASLFVNLTKFWFYRQYCTLWNSCISTFIKLVSFLPRIDSRFKIQDFCISREVAQSFPILFITNVYRYDIWVGVTALMA